MKKRNYTLRSEVTLYPGMVAWHFIHVDKESSARIKKDFGSHANGFGSIRVEVTVRKTKWSTSIFPDSKSKSYVLPVKAKIRKEEGMYQGDMVNFSIKIL